LQNAAEAGHILENKIKTSSLLHLVENVGFANSIHSHNIAIPMDEEFPALDAITTEFIETVVNLHKSPLPVCFTKTPTKDEVRITTTTPLPTETRRNGITASELAIKRTTVG
jgi:ABC-type phosphate transport system ATPase subunit